MSIFSGITDVEIYHNPNEGRVIINENFRKMISGVTDSVNSILKPYKVYAALLTQSGINAPIATVLENTLGGTLVWTRDSVGLYIATLSGAFANIDKVFIPSPESRFTTLYPTPNVKYAAGWNDVNSIYLQSINITIAASAFVNTSADDLISYLPIEIRVYD